MPSNNRSLEELCNLFGTDEATLVDALWRSPNARGYLRGALSELLLQAKLEASGFELERIKEKWNGPKLHHGDYYVRRSGGPWFVLESKGLKSNSEKWHKIRNAPTEPEELEKWFARKRKGELASWWRTLPPERKHAILQSRAYRRARILETHFVSGTAGRAGRAIATPRKDEFHVVALDLFLRTRRHEFIFARSEDLDSPADHPEHLKQNYLIDVIVPEIDNAPTIQSPWTRDFEAVFNSLRHPANTSERQVDERQPGARAAGVEDEEEQDFEEEDSD